MCSILLATIQWAVHLDEGSHAHHGRASHRDRRVGDGCRRCGDVLTKPERRLVPSIPRSWDDAALSTLEVPLPHHDYSPKAVPADYYYRMPVRPIFKTYPVYVPGKEPKGYLTSLRQLAPEIVWDDKGHRPRLETEADWITAGELVFDAAISTTVWQRRPTFRIGVARTRPAPFDSSRRSPLYQLRHSDPR